MFIGSSSEAIPVAKALCKGLKDRNLEPAPWYQKNQFKMSRSYLGSLLEILDRSDLGVFVLSPDDAKRIRRKMMFGENPGAIYKAVLYLDTPTGIPFIYEIVDEALLKGLHGWFDYLYSEPARNRRPSATGSKRS